jgi:hypothetical protein
MGRMPRKGRRRGAAATQPARPITKSRGEVNASLCRSLSNPTPFFTLLKLEAAVGSGGAAQQRQPAWRQGCGCCCGLGGADCGSGSAAAAAAAARARARRRAREPGSASGGGGDSGGAAQRVLVQGCAVCARALCRLRLCAGGLDLRAWGAGRPARGSVGRSAGRSARSVGLPGLSQSLAGRAIAGCRWCRAAAAPRAAWTRRGR